MIKQGGAPPSQGLDQKALMKTSSKSMGKMVVKAAIATKYFWQVRHSGLLGLKYLVAVKGDMIRGIKEEDVKMDGGDSDATLLKGVVDSALLGLVGYTRFSSLAADRSTV